MNPSERAELGHISAHTHTHTHEVTDLKKPSDLHHTLTDWLTILSPSLDCGNLRCCIFNQKSKQQQINYFLFIYFMTRVCVS